MKNVAFAVLLLSLTGITSAAQADGRAPGQYAKQHSDVASSVSHRTATVAAGTANSRSAGASENGKINAGDAQPQNVYGVCFPEWLYLEYCYEN
jgi:hypothetical protein